MKRVQVFYTGGWDSTYMMILLSRREGIEIQPIYIINPKRKSSHIEQKSIQAILKALRLHHATKAKILSAKKVESSEIPKDQAITKARQTLNADTSLGYQYDFLARYAKDHGPCYLGIESTEKGTDIATVTINKYGKLKKVGRHYIVDQKKSAEVLNLVFKDFVFPIIDITEPEMLANIKKWGYEDVMGKIWFCHSPIHGEPCGMCRPCENKMKSRMDFLMPERSKKRYLMTDRWPRLFKKVYLFFHSSRNVL